MPAATRYVEATPELTGVYTDPGKKVATQNQPGLAQRLIDALESTKEQDFKELEETAKAGLEAALGRSLDEGETFSDLDSYTRSQLPKDVLDMNRSVLTARSSLSFATLRLGEINLDNIGMYSIAEVAGVDQLAASEDLRNLDMSNVKDQQQVVDIAIKLQSSLNFFGLQLSKSDDRASEMMARSLEAVGATDMAQLQKSYTGLHRSRFESGEFSVVFDGVTITKDTL